MEKKYISNSILTLSVNGSSVSFMADSKGGSYYCTSNKDIIASLDKHPRKGRLFREDTTYRPQDTAPIEELTEIVKDEELKEVMEVTNCSDAVIYLKEFGEEELKSKKDIQAAAARNGLSFPNLK